MALSGNDAFFYSSINNSSAVNAAVVDFSTLGLATNRVVGYIEPYLTTSIDTNGLVEGKTNLYYTDARSRAAISASTGISYSSTTGLITNTGVTGITGTANQIITSGSTGTITLSTPQDIGISSSPQFARLLNSSLLTGNILYGTNAGNSLSTGTNNVLIGSTAASSLLTGTYNICIGAAAGNGTYPITSGLYNIYIGTNAYPSQASPTREIVIGQAAGNGSNTCTIYCPSGLYVSNLGTGILRATAGQINLAALSDYVSTVLGTSNQVNVSTVSGVVTLSTPQNIATSSSVQFARILNSSIGSSNLLLGTNAGINLTTGGGNTLIGQGSGSGITSGTFNIGLGPGSYGGSGTMSSINAQNIAIGVNSLYSCATSASQNIALGSNALISLTTGNNNIQLGNGATNTLTTGSNNVYIGQAIIPSAVSVSNEGIINLTNSSITGKGANTMFINATAGLYSYIPYAYNLWNNNAAVVSHVEQWIANTAGGSNTGTAPTITSGVLTNLPLGLLKIDISGFLFVVSQTCYPSLQYKPSGGSFTTVALSAAAFTPASFVSLSISANIRISNAADAIQLYYPNTVLYGNTGTDPSLYAPAGNYVPRYMTINFISV